MELDAEKLVERAITDAFREGIKAKFSGYNTVLDKLVSDAITSKSSSLRTLLEESLASCVSDPSFREEIASATRHILAKQLVQRFGGELEKQVNVLKSDPATRARITLAIEEIVKTKPS